MKPQTVPDHEFRDRKVGEVFRNFDNSVRDKLLELRQLIVDEAGRHSEIGELLETLKWGQPSYLPVKPRIGTTLRIGPHPTKARTIGMF